MTRPITLISLAALCAAAACATSASRAGDTIPAGTTTATATTMPADTGWRTLFDGTSTAAWRGYREQTLPPEWRIVDGALTKDTSTNDIITRDEFGDFELTLDWKLAPGGNAGIFYHGTEDNDKIYWSAPEYQLLDDARHPDGHSRLTSAGAAYALYPSPAGIVKPAGEWNSTRIVVRGPHVEHWLNGTKLLEYELWSPDWEAKVKASKFVDYPTYGRAKRGHIGIQGDHSGQLQLRNVRIRELR